MEFRLLGPLEIADDAGVVPLAEGRQRGVLVFLLLHRNETVPSERLIDALWGERPPPTAAKVLQNQVSQLRRTLNDREGERLQTRGRGYALHVGPAELDLDRFEELAQAGAGALKHDEPAEAAERLREALALWRGPPLSDVAYESFAQPEIVRLEERRLVVLEQRFDADLALGRHAQVIAELEALVSEQPLRERPRAQLMLALYRVGRQAEALESYQDARRTLLEERGMEPGPVLRDVQAAILRQDPELAPAPTRWPRQHDRSRRIPVLLAVGGALLLVAAIAALLVESGDELPSQARVVLDLTDNSIAAVDPSSGRVELGLPLFGQPVGLVAVSDTALIATTGPDTLVVADPVTRSLVKTVGLEDKPGAIAACGDDVWIAASERGALQRFRRGYAQAGPPRRWDRTGRGPTAVACGAGAVWVTDGSRSLWRFDSGRETGKPLDAGVPLTGVTVGAGAVWAISSRRATVARVDPRTNAVTPIPISTRGGTAAPSPIGVAATSRAVWVLNANTGTVSVIDAEHGGVTDTIEIGIDRAPRSIAAAGTAVWVANADGTVARIDAADGTAATLEVGEALSGIALSGRRMWLTTRALDNQLPGGSG
jgi:DNA-binding SARP family transcriptional activator/DNA-binding beta-propeller fold protein YncE